MFTWYYRNHLQVVLQYGLDPAVTKMYLLIFRQSLAFAGYYSVDEGMGGYGSDACERACRAKVQPSAKSAIVAVQSEADPGKCTDNSIPGSPMLRQMNPCLVGEEVSLLLGQPRLLARRPKDVRSW